eukprot:scpid104975/ scgid28794/ 
MENSCHTRLINTCCISSTGVGSCKDGPGENTTKRDHPQQCKPYREASSCPQVHFAFDQRSADYLEKTRCGDSALRTVTLEALQNTVFSQRRQNQSHAKSCRVNVLVPSCCNS